jgi:hypothetical protein
MKEIPDDVRKNVGGLASSEEMEEYQEKYHKKCHWAGNSRRNGGIPRKMPAEVSVGWQHQKKWRKTKKKMLEEVSVGWQHQKKWRNTKKTPEDMEEYQENNRRNASGPEAPHGMQASWTHGGRRWTGCVPWWRVWRIWWPAPSVSAAFFRLAGTGTSSGSFRTSTPRLASSEISSSPSLPPECSLDWPAATVLISRYRYRTDTKYLAAYFVQNYKECSL